MNITVYWNRDIMVSHCVHKIFRYYTPIGAVGISVPLLVFLSQIGLQVAFWLYFRTGLLYQGLAFCYLFSGCMFGFLYGPYNHMKTIAVYFLVLFFSMSPFFFLLSSHYFLYSCKRVGFIFVNNINISKVSDPKGS